MKRNAKHKDNRINKIWPVLFWKECYCCKKEFRREPGWQVLTGPYYGGKGVFKYVCGVCAPTFADVTDLLDIEMPTGFAPPPPPTPPKAPPKRKLYQDVF